MLVGTVYQWIEVHVIYTEGYDVCYCIYYVNISIIHVLTLHSESLYHNNFSMKLAFHYQQNNGEVQSEREKDVNWEAATSDIMRTFSKDITKTPANRKQVLQRFKKSTYWAKFNARKE